METGEVDEKLANGYVHCRVFIEIMGAPQNHVDATLNLVVKRLGEEKGVSIVSEQSHPAEAKEKLFSAFAEVELLIKDFATLTRIVFDYMPSSFEVLKPESFRLPMLEVSNFVGDTLAALHQIDFKLKDVNAANQLLERNSANLLKNFLLLMLDSGKKSIKELSEKVGVKPEQLDPFMKAFLQEGLIRKNGDLWEKV